MTHRRPRRPALVASIAAAVVAVITLLAVGAPAYAADAVKVNLQGLGGQVAAGGRDVSVTATFTNTTDNALSGVRVGIRVELAGVPEDAVRVRRQQGGGELSAAGDGDTILFADDDPFELKRRDNQSRKYTLTFRSNAPAGTATITIGALQNGKTLGSAHGTITIRQGNGATTAPNTNPGYIPTYGETPSYTVAAPLTEAAGPVQTPTASVPKSLYLLGTMLIVMGALSLYLIFRPPGRIPARVTGPGPHQVPAAPSWHPHRSEGPRGPGVQGWPTVPRPTDPPRRPVDGPHTGSTRPVRDPGPGTEPLPPWLRP